MTKAIAKWLILSILLAGGTCAPARAEDKQSAAAKADPQTAQHFEKKVGDETLEINYLLYLPSDFESDAKKTWPLLIFLHGSGEKGNNNLELVKKHGPPKLIAAGQQFPFIVVSPQAVRRWEPETLNAMIDDLVEKRRVDKNRIYLTGLSMGGFGTWTMASKYPEKFAAIVPICGGGDTASAGKLKDLPIWVFHGGKDTAVPVRLSEDMVKALKEAGATSVEFTLYPDAGHDSWSASYANPKLYEWLLKQSRGAAK